MSLADFDPLTPGEFRAVVAAWRQNEEQAYARTMAAIRLHAACSVQPHVRNRLTPKDLWHIPGVDDDPELRSPAEELTPEQKKERFEQLKRQRGYE